MKKRLPLFLLAALLVLSWIWPRFGFYSPPPQQPPFPPPGSTLPPEAPPPSLARLTDTLNAMQQAPGFPGASLGLSVLDPAGEPLFSFHAEESMTPASTLKVVTSATALEQLGPDFTFSTELAADRPFELDEEGMYPGDLILVGGGDPMFTTVTLGAWAAALHERGLRGIKGRLIGDARHFPEALVPDAWDWGDVSNYYGAGPSGLNLDFNRFTVTFVPGEQPGSPAPIENMSPALPWVERHELGLTVPADTPSWTSIYGGPYAGTLTFRSRIPLDGGPVEARGAVPDPAYFAARRLADQLKLLDITVEGEITTVRRLEHRQETAPVPEEILLTHASEPLSEIVRYLHATSDNLVTECVFQELIARGSSEASGQEIVTRHWQNRGLDFVGLRMEDGSGLARADYIRPIDLARLVYLASQGPAGDVFLSSLNSYHQGEVRWKGGSMSRVRAYTGVTSGGLTFALMINNADAPGESLGAWRDALVTQLVELPRT